MIELLVTSTTIGYSTPSQMFPLENADEYVDDHILKKNEEAITLLHLMSRNLISSIWNGTEIILLWKKRKKKCIKTPDLV